MTEQALEVLIRPSSVDEMRTVGEGAHILMDHWDEIATNKEVMKLSPNWVQYYEMEERDTLRVLAAWHGHEMVGYSVNQIARHLHYSELTFLQNDLIFVTKAHRGTGLGMRLIDETIQLARDQGCEMVTFHAKPGTSLCRLLGGIGFAVHEQESAMGFQVQDIVFSKVL